MSLPQMHLSIINQKPTSSLYQSNINPEAAKRAEQRPATSASTTATTAQSLDLEPVTDTSADYTL